MGRARKNSDNIVRALWPVRRESVGAGDGIDASGIDGEEAEMDGEEEEVDVEVGTCGPRYHAMKTSKMLGTSNSNILREQKEGGEEKILGGGRGGGGRAQSIINPAENANTVDTDAAAV
jgi:hypothetical protein